MTLSLLDAPPASAEVVVIGGGIIGAATAFQLSRRGLRPLIVEARSELCTLTTPVAAGAYRLQWDERDQLDLVRETVDLISEFRERTGQDEYDPEVRERGYLWLTTEEGTAARQRALVERLHGWNQNDVEILDGEEVRRRFPWVGAEVIQARWRARDGFLDTKQLTLGLAAGSGAGISVDTTVTGFGIREGRLNSVQTDRGAIDCEAAVLCAGPMSAPIAATAGLDLPIETIVRQKLVLADLVEVPADGPMVVDEDTGTHWRPADGGAWLLFTDPETPPSEPTMDVPTEPGFAQRLLDPSSPQAAARTVPFWRDVWERGERRWLLQAGQYAVAPDQRPIIGPSAVEGLFLNAAYGGQGIMLSVAGSRILADELTGATSPHRFVPDRTFETKPQSTL